VSLFKGQRIKPLVTLSSLCTIPFRSFSTYPSSSKFSIKKSCKVHSDEEFLG